MAQLIPLSPNVSCSSKSSIGSTFLVSDLPGRSEQRAVNQVLSLFHCLLANVHNADFQRSRSVHHRPVNHATSAVTSPPHLHHLTGITALCSVHLTTSPSLLCKLRCAITSTVFSLSIQKSKQYIMQRLLKWGYLMQVICIFQKSRSSALIC